jgi:CDP-paratose 2-epimerase
LTGRKLPLGFHDWRPGDQRYYVSDPRLIHTALALPQPLGWRDGLQRLVEWLQGEIPARTAKLSVAP